MQPFWEIVASNAVLVAVLAAGVALLGRIWKNPLCLHLLWVLVLLKLVTPPVVTIPTTLLAEHIPLTSRSNAQHQRPPAHVDASPQELAIPTAVQEHLPLASDLVLSEHSDSDFDNASVVAGYQRIQWAIVLGWIWGIGIVLFASWQAFRIARFRRLFRSSQPPSSALLGIAQGVCRRLGLERVPEIRLLPICVSPLVWSLGGRPRVFLPAATF